MLSLGDFKDEKAAEVKAEEEDEFANVEFVEAELPMAPLPGPGSVAAESQENSALTLQETIDRFGLGSADYRLQLNIPAPQVRRSSPRALDASINACSGEYEYRSNSCTPARLAGCTRPPRTLTRSADVCA